MNETTKTIIQFCLPKDNNFGSADDFFEELIALSKEKDSDEDKWGGFLGESYLKDALENKIGANDYKEYSYPSEDTLITLEKVVENAGNTAQKKLGNPNAPLKVFVYPWFPGEDMNVFEGVMGTTFWAGSFHLYIDFEDFSQSALEKTVVHEYNHAVRLNHFSPFEQTMLEAIIMEGLAEVFREEVVGGKPAPWSEALNGNEVKRALESLQEDFSTKTQNRGLFQDIFFGGDTYKRWTGYSCGYHIVSSYRSDNKTMPWKKLMKKEPENILKNSKFN